MSIYSAGAGSARRRGRITTSNIRNTNVAMTDEGGGGSKDNTTQSSGSSLAAPVYNWVPSTNVPTYNYVPSTFNYQYGYSPTKFNYKYDYTPTKFDYKYDYTPTEFSHEYGYTPKEFKYESEYADLIKAAQDKLANWSYDPGKDPSYNAYKAQYTQNGGRAYTDALAKQAAKTGGVASSYANAAAQQQYNQYMSELSAKVPELEQLAYNRAATNLSMWNDADDRAYSRAFNEFADSENRAKAYADTQYEMAYQTWSGNENLRKAVADAAYERAFNEYTDWENRQRTAADSAYSRAFGEYSDWEDRRRIAADTAYSNAFRTWQTQENAREAAANNAYRNAVAQFNAQQAASEAAAKNSYNAALAAYNTQKEAAAKQQAQADADAEKQALASYLADMVARGDITEAEARQMYNSYNLNPYGVKLPTSNKTDLVPKSLDDNTRNVDYSMYHYEYPGTSNNRDITNNEYQVAKQVYAITGGDANESRAVLNYYVKNNGLNASLADTAMRVIKDYGDNLKKEIEKEKKEEEKKKGSQFWPFN